jgi:hypothetical protein
MSHPLEVLAVSLHANIVHFSPRRKKRKAEAEEAEARGPLAHVGLKRGSNGARCFCPRGRAVAPKKSRLSWFMMRNLFILVQVFSVCAL